MIEDTSQQQLRFSGALNQLAEVTLATSDPAQVLEAMVRIAGTALRVDRALVYDIRLDEGKAIGRAEWLAPQTPEIAPTIGTYPLELFGGAPGAVWSSRTWLTSHAAAVDPRLGPAAATLLHEQMSIASLLWFPFSFRESGYHLLAFNQLTPRRWAEADLEFVAAVGRQVGLALVKQGLLEGLAASEARYRALYDYTPSMFFTVTDERKVSSVNRFALEHLGYPAAELLGHDVLGVFVAEDREEIRRQLEQCFAQPGQVFRWEARKTRKDGTVISVREIARTGVAANGRPEVLIVCDDITEQKRTELAMLQAQKLETLGVLVGGISHDFNNLLATIVGNAELGLLRLPEESPAREPVKLAALAAMRAAELVKQLLSYSAKAPFTRQRIDLNALVRETADLLVVTVGKRARVELTLDASAPAVVADPTQLRQVVMNLVHNAADAMAGREGVVRVRSSVVTLPAAKDEVGVTLPPGRYVRLAVKDEGVGIEPAALERIFDPFFTTKAAGRGLGLSAVRSIAQRHGGAIGVESEVGVGSTFTVLLPVALAEATELRVSDSGSPSLPMGGTVLVIDDDPAVLQVLGDILRELGLVPLVAGGVLAARQSFVSHPEVCCVLLDLTMPEGGGAALVHGFHELRPAVPLVLMSGFAASDASSGMEAELAGFLAKPFTPDALRAELIRVLT